MSLPLANVDPALLFSGSVGVDGSLNDSVAPPLPPTSTLLTLHSALLSSTPQSFTLARRTVAEVSRPIEPDPLSLVVNITPVQGVTSDSHQIVGGPVDTPHEGLPRVSETSPVSAFPFGDDEDNGPIWASSSRLLCPST